jgi:hypothetical protein
MEHIKGCDKGKKKEMLIGTEAAMGRKNGTNNYNTMGMVKELADHELSTEMLWNCRPHGCGYARTQAL